VTGGQDRLDVEPTVVGGLKWQGVGVRVQFWSHWMYNRGKDMDIKFKEYIDQLPSFMEKLRQKELKSRNDLGDIPQKGIYVFYENGNPIYVGRTNRIKKRILEHGRLSSRHNSATFAFKLALKAAERKRIDVSKNRDELQDDPIFRDLFIKAKERISRMSVQVIEIDDPILQTLFEVYTHIALKTPYNDFET